MSYGMNITPGGGETLCVVVLGHILKKNIYWGGRKINHPYNPGFLMVSVGQLSMQICREFLFLKIRDFLLLAQFVIWTCSWKCKIKTQKPQNLPTAHIVWWTKI